MAAFFTVVMSVCAVLGALIVLLSALAMFRAPDALSRINVFSPASGLGLPLVLVSVYIYTVLEDGFSVLRLIEAAVAFLALLIVSSVASNTLSRAAFVSGSPVWRRTEPNRLAVPRDAGQDADLEAWPKD